MRIIIGGALGRMGRELALAAADAGVEVACGVDVAYAGQAASFPIVTGYERIPEDADVLIDFSRPDALPELLQAALTRRMPVVLCTTGYTDVELSSIREAAQTLPVLRSANAPAACGWPDVSLHNGKAWDSWMGSETRQIGVLFAGRNADDTDDDLVLLVINAHWEPHAQQAPTPPAGKRWRLVMHTFCAQPFAPDTPFDGTQFVIGPRSVAILIAENG